jgi:hypothetical protein
MEEENYSMFTEIVSHVIERHSLSEWIFLFIFFVICQLLIGKSKNIGELFLSISGAEEKDIIKRILVGFIAIYFAAAALCVLIILMLLIIKFISIQVGLQFSLPNFTNLIVECSFIWAVVACGHVRSNEKNQYLTEIAHLKEKLLKCEIV